MSNEQCVLSPYQRRPLYQESAMHGGLIFVLRAG
jgi:hypothetical protein